MTESLFEFLNTGTYKGIKFSNDWSRKKPHDKRVEEFFTDLSQMQSRLTETTERIVHYFKYYFDQKITILIPDEETFWSLDEEQWNKTISDTILLYSDLSVFVGKWYFPRHEIQNLQKCIDLHIEPLFAFDLISQAEHFENDPRYKWLFATIALEYAIKEFLVARNPILELFLIENQAPPAFKLYGQILNLIENEKVTLCLKPNDVRIAIEVRNFLVHRPKKLIIDEDDAKTYVQLAKLTIQQLFVRLHPDFPYSRDMVIPCDSLNYEFPKEIENKLTKAKRDSNF